MNNENKYSILQNLKKKECVEVIFNNIENDTLKNWVFEEIKNDSDKLKKVIERKFNKTNMKDFIYNNNYNLEKKKLEPSKSIKEKLTIVKDDIDVGI